MHDKPNVIKDRTYAFALQIIKTYKGLRNDNEYVLSKQLVRSGTSIGANVEEATAAQSKKDFIAKMSISSKEARETNYWLRLLRDSEICPSMDFSPIINESEEIIRILTSIVKTSQENLKKGK